MNADDPLMLNIRAHSALRSGSADWRAHLAALFKSDAPIEPWFRSALAAAFENKSKFGPRIDLKNNDDLRRHRIRVDARYEWMKLGRWINDHQADSGNQENAMIDAADLFRVSEGKCKDAIAYFRRTEPRVKMALRTEAGNEIGRDYIEKLCHLIDADPEGASGIVSMNRELLDALHLPQLSAVGGPVSA